MVCSVNKCNTGEEGMEACQEYISVVWSGLGWCNGLFLILYLDV